MSTTQDKMDILKARVEFDFNSGKNIDAVCANIASFALINGVAFGEILPLVRTIGKSGGFITSLAARKTNLASDMDGLTFSEHDYPQYSSLVGWLAIEYDLPEKHCKDIVKAALKAHGHYIPKKSLLSGWKKTALSCWREYASMDNAQPDYNDVKRCIRDIGGNHNSYTLAYHELFGSLCKLGRAMQEDCYIPETNSEHVLVITTDNMRGNDL